MIDDLTVDKVFAIFLFQRKDKWGKVFTSVKSEKQSEIKNRINFSNELQIEDGNKSYELVFS